MSDHDAAEHVRECGDAYGYSVPVCEIYLRSSGAWHFVNRYPKGEATIYGEYREIVAPSRLVYTEIYAPFPQTVSVVTADFVDEGRRPRLVVTVVYPSLQVRDQVVTSGIERGAARPTKYNKSRAVERRLGNRSALTEERSRR